MWSLLFGIYLQTTIMYHSLDDVENLIFGLLNLLSVLVPLIKLLALLPRKKKLFGLIAYMVRNFLKADYDDFETSILTTCKRKCSFFVCSSVCFTELTIVSYVCAPLLVNLFMNESERVLPFKMYLNVPIQATPYFEIAYITQVLALCPVGFSYFSLDNVLCIINLHIAGQFRILQYRLSDKYSGQVQNGLDQKSDLYLKDNAPDVFKSYIRQHQALITYCNELQEVFGIIVLALYSQVMTFSMLICLDGFQVLLLDLIQRKVIFFFHLLTTVCQLIMFSYSCDCIIRESVNLATAAFSGPWLLLPSSKGIDNLKKDFIMLIMRSNKPCYISGLGFFIVSLETSTRVITTAGSYFTLLQQTQSNIDS
nr:PREDICTED: LOW QUALITY PROTEIN: odorant receptor 22c-like [Megachile rotundata]